MKIYLKYDEILENSQNLLNITKEYDEAINNIKKIYEKINHIWVSDNKEIEIENLKVIQSNLNINKNYYMLLANIMKSISENFLLTEQQACKYLLLENEVKKDE